MLLPQSSQSQSPARWLTRPHLDGQFGGPDGGRDRRVEGAAGFVEGMPLPIEFHLGAIDVLPDADGSHVVYSQEILPEALAPLVERAVSEGIVGIAPVFRRTTRHGRGPGGRARSVTSPWKSGNS